MSGRDKGIPVIDVFAGPGGLGEGFSRFPFGEEPMFNIRLSIEKDANAHKTLLTRAFYRQFKEGAAPEAYYMHLRGELSQQELFGYDEECRAAAAVAKDEARLIELGDKEGEPPDVKKRALVRALINERVGDSKTWVLIGGPPCQAYSLVGRSRMLGVVRREGETEVEYKKRKEATVTTFEKDHRHRLYREYLSIIADHWPPVFVMENVKGLLSATLAGRAVFPMIKEDLSDPAAALDLGHKGHRYRIHSLSVAVPEPGEDPLDADFLIRAEDYGVPQRRHRVILLGVREDIEVDSVPLLARSNPATLSQLFNGLPRLNPGISKPVGSDLESIVAKVRESKWLASLTKKASTMEDVHREILETLRRIEGAAYPRGADYVRKMRMAVVPGQLGEWFADPRLGGVCNHSTRAHMASDLHRYLYASCFAKVVGRSPKLEDFPDQLLPNHSNVKGEAPDLKKFGDRFRVQLADSTATTITSHISKDGHYFIHPEPDQLRSLTVREAARIQTFPDNYFFEGGRTAQYHQVGNAVPPYLAHQIAGVVSHVLDQTRGRARR